MLCPSLFLTPSPSTNSISTLSGRTFPLTLSLLSITDYSCLLSHRSLGCSYLFKASSTCHFPVCARPARPGRSSHFTSLSFISPSLVEFSPTNQRIPSSTPFLFLSTPQQTAKQSVSRLAAAFALFSFVDSLFFYCHSFSPLFLSFAKLCILASRPWVNSRLLETFFDVSAPSFTGFACPLLILANCSLSPSTRLTFASFLHLPALCSETSFSPPWICKLPEFAQLTRNA